MEPYMNISTSISMITENIEKVIIGKRQAIQLLLVALLSDGHVLIEDVPGVGKTMLARAMAISLGGEFKRLQCTPDLLPNDITGVSIYSLKSQEFTFRPGPLFANILLVDEINRATPRTQSALLESMQERQVTVDGTTYPLPKPFIILATENPVEFEGTFILPEAQLDRFLMKITMGYPDTKDEVHLLSHLQREHPIDSIAAVIKSEEINALQKSVWDIFVDDSLREYIVNLVNATRGHPDILLGASPRASLALFRTSQAYAAINGREYVLPDDIQYLAPYVITHRLIISPDAELRGRTAGGIIKDIIEQVKLPLESKTHG
jgi:MoxR-like ATPase